MDIATILGLLGGVAVLYGAIAIEGSNPMSFLNLLATVVVFGGATVAVLTRYTLKSFVGALVTGISAANDNVTIAMGCRLGAKLELRLNSKLIPVAAFKNGEPMVLLDDAENQLGDFGEDVARQGGEPGRECPHLAFAVRDGPGIGLVEVDEALGHGFSERRQARRVLRE